MLTQAMDYDRILAGSRSHQTGVNGENNSVRLSIQGGHLGHDNNGGIARGATPESSGSYGFVRLEGDLLRTEVAGMSLTTGVYGAAGHSSVDVKDDDGSRAGTVRDDAGSLGGYLNLTHTSSGLWADIVAQGTRHSMKASSDNNDFRARGWGWLGSLETGLPFSITDNLMLEPQLQYTWQGLSLDDGQDNAGYVKFGHGSTQHVRAGFRLGSHNDMTFGEGTSSRDTLRDSTKHRVSELPVNWWVQPSVTEQHPAQFFYLSPQMFYFPFIFFDLFFGTCQCRAQEGFRLFNQTQLLVFLTEGFSLLREQPFQLCDANEVFLTHDRFYNAVRSFLQHCQ